MLAHLQATIDALSNVTQVDLDHALELLLACHNRGGIVYICGNGGSAATASHFACDLQKAAGIRAIALTDNVPLITAWANDMDYKFVFDAQLTRLAKPDDMLVLISCSAKSPNIVRLFSEYDWEGVCMWGFDRALFPGIAHDLTGSDPRMVQLSVNSSDYGVIENVHLAICHALTVGLKARLTTKL